MIRAILLTASLLVTAPAFGEEPVAAPEATVTETTTVETMAPPVADSDPSDSDTDATTAAAPSAEIPETDAEAVGLVGPIVAAVQSKAWGPLAGFVLMLLVFVANKLGLKDKVGAKFVPWIAMAVAVAGTTGVSLAGGLPALDAVLQGVGAGFSAVGSWEMLLKQLVATKKA